MKSGRAKTLVCHLLLIPEGWLVAGFLGMLAAMALGAGMQKARQMAIEQSGLPLVRVISGGSVLINNQALVLLPDGAPPAALAKVEGAPPEIVDLQSLVPVKDRRPEVNFQVFAYPRTGLAIEKMEVPVKTKPVPPGQNTPPAQSSTAALPQDRPPEVPVMTLSLSRDDAWFRPGMKFRGMLEFRGQRFIISDTFPVRKKDCLKLLNAKDKVNPESSHWTFELARSTLILEFDPSGHLRGARIGVPVPLKPPSKAPQPFSSGEGAP